MTSISKIFNNWVKFFLVVILTIALFHEQNHQKNVIMIKKCKFFAISLLKLAIPEISALRRNDEIYQ